MKSTRVQYLPLFFGGEEKEKEEEKREEEVLGSSCGSNAWLERESVPCNNSTQRPTRNGHLISQRLALSHLKIPRFASASHKLKGKPACCIKWRRRSRRASSRTRATSCRPSRSMYVTSSVGGVSHPHADTPQPSRARLLARPSTLSSRHHRSVPSHSHPLAPLTPPSLSTAPRQPRSSARLPIRRPSARFGAWSAS